jgi:hypothetical protein
VLVRLASSSCWSAMFCVLVDGLRQKVLRHRWLESGRLGACAPDVRVTF